MKCILWCGRQNVALRGHRDDDKVLEQGFAGNPGNFKALLQFRIDAGDNVLEKHFETAAKMPLIILRQFRMSLLLYQGNGFFMKSQIVSKRLNFSLCLQMRLLTSPILSR
jgi:hypothetical protein